MALKGPLKPGEHDVQAANRCLRDIVALSTLPTLWQGADAARIAESLAASLFTTVQPAFLYVSLRTSRDDILAAVFQTDRYQTNERLARELGPRLLEWATNHDPEELLVLPELGDDSNLAVSTRSVGFEGEYGVIAAGFYEGAAPDALQHLMLNVAATQATVAIRSLGMGQKREWAEQLLRESEEFNRSMIESSSDCIKVLDRDGTLLFISEGGQQLLCVEDPRAVLGLQWMDFWRGADREAAKKAVATAAAGGIGRFVGMFPVRDEPRYWDIAITPIRDADGTPARLLAISRDVTQKRLAEQALRESTERYSSLLSVVTDVPWTTDAQGRFTTLQPGWAAYTGQTWEEMRSFGWSAAFHPEDRPHVMKLWAEATQNKSLYESHGRLWHATSEQHRHVIARAVPVMNGDGLVREWVGACTDVHDQRQSELALVKAEKLAAVGKLASTIAHEINNPLEAVTNIIYLLLQDETLPARAHEYLKIADQELARVSHLTKQTLAFHRGSASSQELKLGELVEGVLDIFGPRMRNLNVKVEKEIDARAALVGINGELRQVIANLVSNSLDAMSPGGRLWVRVRRSSVKGTRGTSLIVADSGSGISAAAKRHIFEPFFTTKSSVGTGLGLWVTKGIVAKHGGRIRLRSSTAPGRSGTVFSIFFPEGAFVNEIARHADGEERMSAAS